MCAGKFSKRHTMTYKNPEKSLGDPWGNPGKHPGKSWENPPKTGVII